MILVRKGAYLGKLIAPVIVLLLAASCSSRVPLPTPDIGPRVTVPQDFAVFLRANNHLQQFGEFYRFLSVNGVEGVVPVYQLFRQGTDWQKHALPLYAFPEREVWSQIVPTLKFVKSELKPVLGRLEVMSGYRSGTYNRLAGGAPRSRHLQFSALDIMPQRQYKRDRMQRWLLTVWAKRGRPHNLGLGLYGGLRFHVDTGGYRKW